MAYYDMNQGYYDPSQGYYDHSQGYYDPNQVQFSNTVQEEAQEDSESMKLKKEQADKERLEALESNRLYLRKIRKQCVREDFAELERKQLFLFEVVIESLEVNSEGTLGLTPSVGDSQAYVTVLTQFLNSPHLEIFERDKPEGSHIAQDERNNYFQTVGDSWQTNNQVTSTPSNPPGSTEVDPPSSGEVAEVKLSVSRELDFDVKWENSTGKSCLFSMSVLEIIHNLDKHPVNIQVDRCVSQAEDPENREPLGYASIRLPDEFGMAVLESLRSGVILPISSVHRQACDLRNVFGVKKGKAEVLVRLSVFGPVIITSFQSVGDDRQYVFQPSPLNSEGVRTEHQVPRSELLKPIISEEENTIGITVQKNVDIFQKAVLWNLGVEECSYEDNFYEKYSNIQGSDFDTLSTAKIPYSSKVDLCRNMKPPTDPTVSQRFGNRLCDWHNLVSSEINNSPIGNCGCLPEGDLADPKRWKGKDPKGRGRLLHSPPVSRPGVQQDSWHNLVNCGCLADGDPTREKGKDPKGRGLMMSLPPVSGLGLQQDPKECQCDCPFFKKALLKPSFHA